MASIRVHEDVENQVVENRQKMAGNAQQGQKRTVLGVIGNRLDVLPKAKPVSIFFRPICLLGFCDCFWGRGIVAIVLFAVCRGGQFESCARHECGQ